MRDIYMRPGCHPGTGTGWLESGLPEGCSSVRSRSPRGCGQRPKMKCEAAPAGGPEPADGLRILGPSD